jgi:hypothetical protein
VSNVRTEELNVPNVSAEDLDVANVSAGIQLFVTS